MSNSYRIRTQVGVDKSIKILLDQDFDFLEILSLKILQSEIYTRQCSDYGVVIGRVVTNGGFGIPNAKLSIFIPLNPEDENNPIITDLYPYKTLNDTNEDGYRYNLLPYTKSYSQHVPTGTFFSREDVLTEPNIIEVFDKYYKYTARTNDSGDFMIFGVPVGSQTLHLDIDLSDIGEFSLSPQDLVRMGMASESQVGGTNFRSSTNLAELPQIVSINRVIQVEPLWGQPEVCNLGITRTDFDLTEEINLNIQPTAIFMGSLLSDDNNFALKRSCKPKFRQGELCNLVTGPGQILAIRQTISTDSTGRPILELADLENGGQVIDENGAWMFDVPMNMDYITTNEFGERVISNDPKIGIPTTAKYRFKIKWNQSPSLSEEIKRGYFLVPNVREYGWNGGSLSDVILRKKSYAFSLDWDDYANPQDAINCEDTFYPMIYNKVYTVSQMIDQFKQGSLPFRLLSIKNILDDKCESENYKFPTNDSIYRPDILYLLFILTGFISRILLMAVVIIAHLVAGLLFVLKKLSLLLFIIFLLIAIFYFVKAALSFPAVGLIAGFITPGLKMLVISLTFLGLHFILKKYKGVSSINLPLLLYDQCEFCDCKDPGTDDANVPGADASISSIANSGPGGSVSTNQAYPFAPLLGGPYFTNNLSDYNYGLVSSTITGKPVGICESRTPGFTEYYEQQSGKTFRYYSLSLNMSERINLFNTKAKYFDAGAPNPGGGVNQIEVKVEPVLNPGINDKHTDNVIVMLFGQGTPIVSGDMFTFQNPVYTKDPNLTGGTSNQFGNNAITGTPINPTSINITYTKSNGLPGSVLYNLPIDPNSSTEDYYKFPADMEYFQVVTAMTINNYNSLTTSTSFNTFNNRIFNNLFNTYRVIDDGNLCTSDNGRADRFEFTEINTITNSGNFIIAFFVRGVDPYSKKYKIQYDLSKLFGYSSFPISGGVKVIGDFRLNIPIQGGFKNVRHNIPTQISTDPYSSMELYYDTTNFVPTTFIPFTSKLAKYYSSLDNGTPSTAGDCSCPTILSVGTTTDTNYGLKVSTSNFFTKFRPVSTYSSGVVPSNFMGPTTTNPIYCSYLIGEPVEGGSVMILNNDNYNACSNDPPVSGNYRYVSPMYTDAQVNISYTDSSKLVMRSDRLPTSTDVTVSCSESLALQQNANFSMFLIPDSGVIGSSTTISASNGTGTTPENDQPQNFTNSIVESLNECSKSAPLRCYDFVGGEYVVNNNQNTDGCYEESFDNFITEILSAFGGGGGSSRLTSKIFKNGCYQLVTIPIFTLLVDLGLVNEWYSRVKINFGACRNVWSHIFTNNWINGTLYAHAFKNDRLFDNNNVPSSFYCGKNVYLDLPLPSATASTNSFYYRSSPYDSSNDSFVGISLGVNSINNKNLLTPTTIMDLGPRNDFIQEIILSDNYDGYVLKDLKTTTFGDVSDILNLLILSRIVNSSTIQLVLGTGGASVLNYFSRNKLRVDGDYSQLISINSELGVNEFDAESYPSNPSGQDPIYFNGDVDDAIIGIFFSSDTQVRDYISPKRTIINSNISLINSCVFNNIPTFSQKVPFYQWEIKTNADSDSIFGSEDNDWYTNPISSGFHKYRYQQMDRINPSSRYFMSTTNTLSSQLKGYIYSLTPTGDLNPSAGSIYPLTPNRIFSVGSPFHFYFGLKKGKSAFDLFSKKWINGGTGLE